MVESSIEPVVLISNLTERLVRSPTILRKVAFNMRLQQSLLVILFGGLLVLSCSSPGRDSYRGEEIAVYNDILPELLKPTIKYTPDGKKSVFFMFDSLTRFENSQTEGKGLLQIDLERRQFNIGDIRVPNCRFIRATKYPRDTRLEILTDMAEQDKDEFFTHRWITCQECVLTNL